MNFELGTLNLVPKITDFGLAKCLDADCHQTKSGAILGTPSYMAPEQAQGRTKTIGPGADVYGLGAILYELLTGRPPFKGASALETLEQVRWVEAVAPRRLQPRLPRDVETICLKCLAKDAHERYASAHELAEELNRFLRHEPIKARPVGALRRLGRWCRRNPMPATVSFLAIVSLLAVAGVAVCFGLYQAQASTKLRAALREAQLQRRQANRLTARLALDRGQTLGEQGDVATSLLWMARGLDSALQGEDTDLQRAIRLNLDGWSRQLHPLRVALPHDQLVLSACFSPDGRLVLTAGADHAARLWDATTGKPVGPPLRHQNWVLAAAFSPDGKTILTGSGDKTAQLWDAATGKPKGLPLRHQGHVLAVAFGPDNKTIATGSADKTARLWRADTGRPVGAVLHHDGDVRSLAYSPDGRLVVTGSLDGTARIWETATGRLREAALAHTQPVNAVVVSPDGTKVATASGTTVRLWSLATGRHIGPPLRHAREVQVVVFSPDSKTVLTGSGNSVRLWEVGTGLPRGALLRHQGEIGDAVFSPDGRLVLTAGKDMTARLWDVAAGTPVGAPMPHPGEVLLVAFGPDGRTVLTTSLDQASEGDALDQGRLRATTRLWALDPARVHGTPLKAQQGIVTGVFSADGRRLLTGASDGSARVWDVASGKSVGPVLAHPGEVLAITLGPPPGRRVITVSRDPKVPDQEARASGGKLRWTGKGKSIWLWNADSGKPVGSPRPLPGCLEVGFSPDGRILAAADLHNAVRLQDARTGKPIGVKLRHQGSVMALAFSPDGRRIVTGSMDRTARVWQTANGQPLGKVLRHQGIILAVAFSPDGRQVLTGSTDRTARLWDAVTGKPRTRPLLHPCGIMTVALSPDGRTVLTIGMDQKTRLWQAATGRALGPPLAHAGTVAAAFSPDSRLVLTGGTDRTARLWEAATGKPVGPPLRLSDVVATVAFGPSGRIALIGSRGQAARLWPVPACLAGKAERITWWARSLTRMEMGPDGTVQFLDAAGQALCRQRLQELGGPP